MLGTGHHAAVSGGGGPGTDVTVIDLGRVFDVTTDLDGVPDGYRRMASRESLKVLVRP